MMWFRDRKSRPVGWGTADPPVPDREPGVPDAARGNAMDHLPKGMHVMDIDAPPTTREPYPHLNSIQKDEEIYLLKGEVKLLRRQLLGVANSVSTLQKLLLEITGK